MLSLPPAPPRVCPLQGHRYRSLEAQGGWIVRPQIENHCADTSDGVEGLIISKVRLNHIESEGHNPPACLCC